MNEATERRPAYNLTYMHFSRVHGDVTVYGTWNFQTGEPCLFIVPTNAKLHRDSVTPYVVPLPDAHLWPIECGDGAHVARETYRMAEALGQTPSPKLCMRLSELVLEHIDELIKMPPAPKDRQAVVADAFAQDVQTGEIIHREILNDV